MEERGYPSTVEYQVAEDPRVRVHVRDLGLACCAVEFAAAVARGLLVPAEPLAEGDPSAHVLVVSGTVTDALHDDIRADWESLPEPRVAVAFGACSSTGGPYWDSYAVTQGIDEVLPVSRYVPGCPPRPLALVAALLDAASPS